MWFAVIVDDSGCFFSDPEYFDSKADAVKYAQDMLDSLPSRKYGWVVYRMTEEAAFEKP